ncbi:zinc finger protein ZPR1-like [Amphiura filiformis]|uniref:zinc finger protein ZPR1-like n=1 Tax=Amphiura filiformis TaxID=82378 RepID=UPI003B214DD7
MSTEQPYGNAPLFRDLQGDEIGDLEATQIESLCMNCHENGMTRLLLTKIPFFQEIVISSFDCEHCCFSNNEVQPGGRIQDKGCRIVCKIQTPEDMSRQVVKSDSASLRIPELDFEIPANSQKEVILTTVEGLISRAVMGLEQDQPVRRIMHPEAAEQIDGFIGKLKNLQPPFQMILDDPTGNSYIENLMAPKKDPSVETQHYTRTHEQDQQLGLSDGNEGELQQEAAEAEGQRSGSEVTVSGGGDTDEDVKDEVLQFAVNCSECNSPAKTNMKVVNIPYFKEVIIMAMVCEACGYRTNEVKSGAGIEPKGRKLSLRITDSSDLSRDVLKSETCGFMIPEIGFELTMGTLGGKFTTLEGLLGNIKDQLSRMHPFVMGDSAPNERAEKMKEFLEKLDKIIACELKVTVVLDDPAGNSYIQNVYAPDPDPEMVVEEYDRTAEQNDELGITDMRTENYT